jgi:phosphate transport system substrate-binding protein
VAPFAPVRAQDVTSDDLHIAATPSTKPILTALSPILQASDKLHLAVTADLTSADVVDAVGAGKATVGFITRPINGRERSAHPDARLIATSIGMEAVALGVSNDVWDGGVTMITKDNMKAIYEKKIVNWKDLGGPDEKITFFNFKQGEGIWEIFAEWLYGDNRKAPLPKVQNVNTSSDARDTLEFTPGAICPIPAAFVDDARCHGLAIDLGPEIAKPVASYIVAGKYPMVRPLMAVTVDSPVAGARTLIEYLLSPAGQELVLKSGDLGLDAVPKPSPSPTY